MVAAGGRACGTDDEGQTGSRVNAVKGCDDVELHGIDTHTSHTLRAAAAVGSLYSKSIIVGNCTS